MLRREPVLGMCLYFELEGQEKKEGLIRMLMLLCQLLFVMFTFYVNLKYFNQINTTFT